MCAISGIFGPSCSRAAAEQMIKSQHHRGPDAVGLYLSPHGQAAVGHNRLSIIDLSDAGRQPMASACGRRILAFNGEIYNYLELRQELQHYPYRTHTDTEVILAAYEQWGEACLDHFQGMFAFVIWDEFNNSVFAARDRFGVKPLYYSLLQDGSLFIASEIKALHAAGVPRQRDDSVWATYLVTGLHDHSHETFWRGICSLPAGHVLHYRRGSLTVTRWYNLGQAVGKDLDNRPLNVVEDEYLSLLENSITLRFRSDVPVGVALSGGLDSSTLIGLVQRVQGQGSCVKAFTYITGDPDYDELPWTRKLLAHTHHQSVVCVLKPAHIPDLARSVYLHQDEPFGGFPTLAYALIFERARQDGVLVLLDGQGMDEQWAGYDYYPRALKGSEAGVVQATRQTPVRPDCLVPEFRALARPFQPPTPFNDPLRDLQIRDACHSKIPRALRFNDRVSMRSAIELREPFLDHRLFELAIRQPSSFKINDGATKWLLRRLARRLLPQGVVEAPKRPVQTPQREWLRGPLRPWAEDLIELALNAYGGIWLDVDSVRQALHNYCLGQSDNSYYVWQWISLGLDISITA